MARTRTFIAVPVGGTTATRVAKLIQSLQREVRDVKWVTPENFHFTLHFLGEVDDLEIPALCQLLDNVTKRAAPFRLTVGEMGAFPSIERPRTLWVGTSEGEANMQSLHERIGEALREMGYRTEKRRYKPHLTLGRISTQAELSSISSLLDTHQAFHAGTTDSDHVCLMASHLGRHGPTYQELATCKLRGS